MKNIMEQKVIKNWNAIVDCMFDDEREQVHAELAPCTEVEFLKRYCELDKGMTMTLAFNWSIDIDEL